jgi:hypothetical protein
LLDNAMLELEATELLLRIDELLGCDVPAELLLEATLLELAATEPPPLPEELAILLSRW